MSPIKKRLQFQKVLGWYDMMKKKIASCEGNDNSDETILLLNSENLNYDGCEKVFFMLRHILTLKAIIVKSQRNHIVANDIVTSSAAEKYKNGPVLFTRYSLNILYKAITDYLYNSDRIKVLAFKNIPITKDLPILCQGIRNNKSLRVLQFEECDMCDDGCIQICQTLRNSPIETLGLQKCKISISGASWLAWLLREQTMQRSLTSWNKTKNDIEYKTEQGIRKLILNDNPGIKDNGARFIIDKLLDDNWLIHIHLRNAGLTDLSGVLILRLLKQNKSLTIFDVTRNQITSAYLIDQISEVLAKTIKNLENETHPKFEKEITKSRRRNALKRKDQRNDKVDSNRQDKLKNKANQKCTLKDFSYSQFQRLIDGDDRDNLASSMFTSNCDETTDAYAHFNNDYQKFLPIKSRSARRKTKISNNLNFYENDCE